MPLPPELQTLVCRNMTKAELKVARLICKSFDQAAVPILFGEVFIMASYLDLENADLIASRFGLYIKIITVSFVKYGRLSKELFFMHGNLERRRRGLERGLEKVNGHREHGFDVYSKAKAANLEINKSGEFLATLSLILSKSPNVRKMILTSCGNNDLYDASYSHPHGLCKQDDLCPFKVCNLSVSEHMTFHVRPRSSDGITPKIPNPLHLAMLAISTAKISIPELAIHDGYNALLSSASFEMTERQCSNLIMQFKNLTKLRLRFGKERLRPETVKLSSETVTDHLSFAVNLKSLCIEDGYLDGANNADYPAWVQALSRCNFPKLRSLILSMMNSEKDELLKFLEASPCLENMMLEWFTLNVGSWGSAVERIRSVLQLRSVLYDNLGGGSPTFQEDKVYSNDHHMVENFFLSNGKNPFTGEALDLWTGEDRETKWEANKDLDFEERYQMFH